MNVTASRTGLTPQLWSKKFFAEYVRSNRLARYMGDGPNAIIQLNEDLSRNEGDTITFAAARRLVGAGVSGNTVLEGNEEILDLRSMKLAISVLRHAVAVTEWDQQRSIIDLLQAARPALKNWAMEKLRTDLIAALSSINGTAYGSANATARNLWLTNNADRVQFGASVANNASNVHATSLANIDNTADKMTGDLLSLAKRRAQTATPHIQPTRVDDDDDEEWYVVFMPSLVFRDFRNDPDVIAANKDARPREGRWMDNPLFAGGDLVWDGMIVREIPELPVLTGVGAGSIDVAASYLLGAQALGVAWARRTRAIRNVRDYDYVTGVGVMEMRGVGKLQFGKNASADTTDLVDNGVFTIFTAAVADS